MPKIGKKTIRNKYYRQKIKYYDVFRIFSSLIHGKSVFLQMLNRVQNRFILTLYTFLILNIHGN